LEKDEKKDASGAERRKKIDRRNGEWDELFRHAVITGFFEDVRKGSRRKGEKKQQLDIRVFLN
jgi:hypothetical protein